MTRGSWQLVAILVGALVVLGAPTPAQAGDPRLAWYTLATPRFRIHFHGGLERHAQRVATLAEAISADLERETHWRPRQVTDVVLTDDSDSANGSATVVPHQIVRLYATAPNDMDALGDYDEWLSLLFTHEHTHILHISNVTGMPAILNALLGRTYAPNQIQPKWIIEGWAVHLESKYTSGGRLRSPMYDMYLRADVLDERLASLDVVSNDPRRWPGGTLWYLYGGKFVEWIEATYGPDTMAAISAHYGRRLLSWGINRTVRHATGRTYPELWRGWQHRLRRDTANEVAAIRARGQREGQRLTHLGRGVSRPRWIPAPARLGAAAELLFFADDGRRPSGLYRLPLVSPNRAEQAPVLVTRSHEPGACFDPDGNLYYTSTAPSARRYYFGDLHRLTRGGIAPRGIEGAVERLTVGRRTRDPDVSPDGRRIVYVTNQAGTTTLRIAEIDASGALSNERALVPSAAYEQAFTPRFSPDGRRVAYGTWTRGGYRDIRVVDVQTGQYFSLFHDRAVDQQPSWSPDGRTLYFTSDRTGVANVYAFELASRRLQQVTNVLTGAFMPEPSGDGTTLYYVGYTSRGYDLFALPVDRDRFLPAIPYVDRRPSPRPRPPASLWPVRPYRPATTLRPRAFAMEYGPGTFGQTLALSTASTDATGVHSVAAALALDGERGVSSASVDYAYDRLPTTLRLSVSHRAAPRQDYRFGEEDQRFVELTTGVTTGISTPLARAFDHQELSLSYSAHHVDATLPVGTRADPYALRTSNPYRGTLSLVHLGYSYSNTTRTLYSPGNQRGLAVGIGADYAGLATGSETSFASLVGRVRGYLPLARASQQVLALAVSGGISGGEYSRRGTYYSGGFVDGPVLDAFRDGLSASAFVLRGYAPSQFVGSRYLLGNAEYRAPLWFADRGLSTLPVFLRSLSGVLFVDYGGAFSALDPDHPLDSLQLGLGGELWLELTFGYFSTGNIRLGYARGTDSSALSDGHKYLVVSSGF